MHTALSARHAAQGGLTDRTLHAGRFRRTHRLQNRAAETDGDMVSDGGMIAGQMDDMIAGQMDDQGQGGHGRKKWGAVLAAAAQTTAETTFETTAETTAEISSLPACLPACCPRPICPPPPTSEHPSFPPCSTWYTSHPPSCDPPDAGVWLSGAVLPLTMICIANVLAWFFLFGNHVLSIVNTDDSYDPYRKYPTYLTPAAWVNYIYGGIYLLFAGFAVWQFAAPDADGIVVHGYGIWFVAAALMNALWFNLWDEGRLFLALIVILFASGFISAVVVDLVRTYPARNIWERIFVHWPSTAFHAWILYVVWINISALITSVHEDGPHLIDYLLVYTWLFLQVGAAIGHFEWKSSAWDPAHLIVTAWAVFGVAYGQSEYTFIFFPALAAGVVMVLYTFKPIFARKASDAEHSPLLG
ncbi:uncharacterized protein BJ171DRAFT_564200 [Polychytrium aggregatum]|uniref:uncharacterized protein n=1 Tax=Polychytrium aggregatum TaxID=110093 RepID=UPI0022FF3B06|nr:uncharacterized protein BJ171DRAFT_564200 [Polychytrium aggregatum]KAI9209666.1 hypothetical protein BJ171DRAFT_564200 [Polychytrium aggregatum]